MFKFNLIYNRIDMIVYFKYVYHGYYIIRTQ